MATMAPRGLMYVNLWCCVLQTDFLLVMLRDMIQTYPNCRVVLMSATIDTTLFVDYFGSAEVVEVYGRVHPVQGGYITL